MITTTIPTNLDFPNRGILERDAFVNAQETAQDLLAGAYTTALNQYATELNSTQAEINLKWEQVKSQAVTGSYSQAYIDATFTPKILNTQTAKTTPVDADLIPLSDSASSFGLKKLSIVNLITKAKNDIISAFGVLISGLTDKATPADTDMIVIADSASSNASKKLTFANLKAMIFTNSALTGIPTAPTPTTGDNSTKIATTEFVTSFSEFNAGSKLEALSSEVVSYQGTTPTKIKEISVAKSGVVTVSFSMASGGSSYTTYGRVYKNGVAAGILRSTTSTAYTTYSENINVNSGDLIQLYIYASANYITYGKDFKILVANPASSITVI